jgi:hypothetical protein
MGSEGAGKVEYFIEYSIIDIINLDVRKREGVNHPP